MMYGINLFFLYAKIREHNGTPSHGGSRNAGIPDDFKCRLRSFTLHLPRLTVQVIAQVVNHDERRNVHVRSREFSTFVPRYLIIVLQAWGCINTVLHLWYICCLFVLETTGHGTGNTCLKGGHKLQVRFIVLFSDISCQDYTASMVDG